MHKLVKKVQLLSLELTQAKEKFKLVQELRTKLMVILKLQLKQLVMVILWLTLSSLIKPILQQSKQPHKKMALPQAQQTPILTTNKTSAPMLVLEQVEMLMLLHLPQLLLNYKLPSHKVDH